MLVYLFSTKDGHCKHLLVQAGLTVPLRTGTKNWNGEHLLVLAICWFTTSALRTGTASIFWYQLCEGLPLQHQGWASVLFKRTFQSLRSFPFFMKERNDLCVLFRSLQKNGTIFAFFSVLYKRTEQSLRSFPFFIKERNDLCVLFRSL